MVLQRSALHQFHDNIEAVVVCKGRVVVNHIGVPKLAGNNLNLRDEGSQRLDRRISRHTLRSGAEAKLP